MMLSNSIDYLKPAFIWNKHELIQVVVTANVILHENCMSGKYSMLKKTKDGLFTFYKDDDGCCLILFKTTS